MGEKSKRTETVVDCHGDDAFAREGVAVVVVARARAFGVRAAEDPYHHGTPLAGTRRSGPDVEVEAVFTRGRRVGQIDRHVQPSGAFGLDAHGTEGVALADAVPPQWRLRRLPPQRTDGRRRERDAAE